MTASTHLILTALVATVTITTTTIVSAVPMPACTNSTFLPSQSGIGPSFCPNGFGSNPASLSNVEQYCDGSTWMPLGATGSGVPVVHAVYYYKNADSTMNSVSNLVKSFIGGVSSLLGLPPLPSTTMVASKVARISRGSKWVSCTNTIVPTTTAIVIAARQSHKPMRLTSFLMQSIQGI